MGLPREGGEGFKRFVKTMITSFFLGKIFFCFLITFNENCKIISNIFENLL